MADLYGKLISRFILEAENVKLMHKHYSKEALEFVSIEEQ